MPHFSCLSLMLRSISTTFNAWISTGWRMSVTISLRAKWWCQYQLHALCSCFEWCSDLCLLDNFAPDSISAPLAQPHTLFYRMVADTTADILMVVYHWMKICRPIRWEAASSATVLPFDDIVNII